MDHLVVGLLHGLSYGLLLFLLTSGLTLVFSLMGVLNFAHASFYMLGAYCAYALGARIGFLPALLATPPIVGGLGMLVERFALRRAHAAGHVAELLMTFGLALIFSEVVQLVWGRASVPYRYPDWLDRPLFTSGTVTFPVYKALMAATAVAVMGLLWAVVARTRVGLVIRASLGNPEMVQALGHDVPRVFMLVFGLGAALAGLAGALGGAAFVTEPNMATAVGAVVFVVCVVGGMGSLSGAFWASLLIALIQTFAVDLDVSIADAAARLGLHLGPGPLVSLTAAQAAPMLPFVLMVAVLIVRPGGLFGGRVS